MKINWKFQPQEKKHWCRHDTSSPSPSHPSGIQIFFLFDQSQANPSQNLGEVNSINWKPNFSLIAQASASMRGHKAVWKVIGSQIKEMWLFLDAESILFNGAFVTNVPDAVISIFLKISMTTFSEKRTKWVFETQIRL